MMVLKEFKKDISPKDLKVAEEIEKVGKESADVVKNIEPLLNEMAKGGK